HPAQGECDDGCCEQLSCRGNRWATSVAFSPDGKFLARGDFEGMLKLLEIRTGQEVISFNGRHNRPVTALVFSADGRRLVSGSDRYRTLKMWDPHTGREILTFKDRAPDVQEREPEVLEGVLLVLSPDGRRLATEGDGQTLQLWDTESGLEVLTLE